MKLDFPTSAGMYVLSFNMERPMVYYEYRPESDRYVDNTMIKVGKCKNIKTRMRNYIKTYGFREYEPPSTTQFWKSKGFESNYLNRCLGCDSTQPHHHVIFEYIKETESLDEQDRKDIEKEIKFLFQQENIFGEYYRKEVRRDLISELSKLINEYGK